MTSGGELAIRIRCAALNAGMSIDQFVKPLSPSPGAWLRQLEKAATPKTHTVERIEALLRGDEVPPPPPNNFQKSPRGPQLHPSVGRREPASDNLPRVDRDPCPRCGIRGDIGCHHRKAA